MKLGVVTLFGVQLLGLAAPTRSSADVWMWDLVRSSEWDVMVRSVERRFDPLPQPDGELTRPAGQFIVFAVDLTNRSDRPLAPGLDDFALSTAGDAGYANRADQPFARVYALAEGRAPFGDPISPGATVTTLILFDVAPNSGRLTLHFSPASQPIQIDECKCNLPSPVRELITWP